MSRFIFCFAFIVSALLSCNNSAVKKESSGTDSALLSGPQPAYLYFNGKILAKEGDSIPFAEALVERSGKVVYVGSLEESVKEAGDACVRIDLAGKTLMPGFTGALGRPLYYGR